MNRHTGILCPIASLNGEFGIGQMGKSAYEFIDFLADCGFKQWQVLPINPVGAGNSPYSSPSAFAGYYALIDPQYLVDEKLATSLELPSIYTQEDKVNYGQVEKSMNAFLRKVFSHFYQSADSNLLSDYELFKSKNSFWLNNFALYTALKEKHDNTPWYDWPIEFKFYKNVKISGNDPIGEEIEFHKFVQYIFFKQWKQLKDYSNKKGIEIIGDMPIYVSHDSADVWSQTELFELNEDLSLQQVAGVPPDFFAQDGQLWGFPIYKWDMHKKTDFSWWQKRWNHLQSMFDYVRFDHFRAIEAYWSVPADHPTARFGKWTKAPGDELLSTIYPHGSTGMIAENLGDISKEVEDLRKAYKIPGMKILQFAFGGNVHSEHLPHSGDESDILYTGTHDNETLKSWASHLAEEQKQHIKEYYGIESIKTISSTWLIDRILTSGARNIIIPIQDLLNLDDSSRTNIPGTVSDENWSWRLTNELLSQIKSKDVFYRLQFFGRV